jgi:hypothetical protein
MRRNLIGRKLLVASIGVASVSYACGNRDSVVGNFGPGPGEGEGQDAASAALDGGGFPSLLGDSGTDASDAEPPDAAWDAGSDATSTDAAPEEAGDAGQADAQDDAPADAAEEG